jgi:hypothetical protein
MSNALIICPEITKGMKSVGSKSLVKLKRNLTVIEYQISQLQKIRPLSITLSIGFDAEKIQQTLYRHRSVRFITNNQYINTNHGKSLIEYIDKYQPKDLLVISSGILIKNNLISKRYLHNNSKIFILNKSKNNFSVGCSSSPDIQYLFYDMPESWSEIVYLNNEAINSLQSYDPAIFHQMYLFEIINMLLTKNLPFDKIYIKKNDIMKINNLKDITSAKNFI